MTGTLRYRARIDTQISVLKHFTLRDLMFWVEGD